MATWLDPTTLLDVQFDEAQGEVRKDPRYGILRQMERSTQAARSSMGTIRGDIEQTLSQLEDNVGFQIPTLKEKPIATTSVESFNIPVNLGESDFMSVSKITTVAGFWYLPAIHASNKISSEDYLRDRTNEVDEALADAREANTIAALDARRTQILPGADKVSFGAANFSFNGATDELEVNLAGQQDNFYMRTAKLLEQVGTFGMRGDMLGMSEELALAPALSAWVKAGAGNSENQQNDMNTPISFMESTNIASAATQGTAYIMKAGALAYVDNSTYDYRNNTQTRDGWEWSRTANILPKLGRGVNLLYNSKGLDASQISPGSSHLVTTGAEMWSFVDKYYIINTYNSDLTTRSNDIVRLNLSNT